MSSWKIEKKLFDKDIKTELIGKYRQLLFTTNLTDEQIDILDEREKNINAVLIIIMFFSFILGILFSYGCYKALSLSGCII